MLSHTVGQVLQVLQFKSKVFLVLSVSEENMVPNFLLKFEFKNDIYKFGLGFCEFSLQQATGYTTSFVTDAINEIVSVNYIKD